MMILAADVADPSLWSQHGPMGLVAFACFSLFAIIVKWAMNHFDNTSKSWLTTSEAMSAQWRSTVKELDENHRAERKEWRESHQREWQELKADHSRERAEWRDALSKAIQAIETSNETTQALHLALKDLPGHLERKIKAKAQ